jgi:hypothetical protein
MYYQRQEPEPPPESSNRRLLAAVLIVGAVSLACALAALAGAFMVMRNRGTGVVPTTAPATDTPAPKVQISLEPTGGALGSPVTVRGNGWAPGEVVIVFLLSPTGDINQSLTVAVAVADSAGGIEKSFTMPRGQPWDQLPELTVLARSNRTGNEARAAFQPLPPTATPLPRATDTPEPTPTPATPTPTPTQATATPTRTPVVVSDWLGEYWTNQNLQGDPVVQRNEVQVNFAWGTGSPDLSVPIDHFSARWTRELDFTEGAYTFHIAVDDGARLWVDQRLVINEWHDSGLREYTAPVYLTGGRHFVKMEYYDAVDNAVAQLWWTPLTEFAGWRAEYYENPNLSGAPVVVRDEPQINFDWGEGAPQGVSITDSFSARWTRTLDFSDGKYTFHAMADDGVRLWVDDRLLIDEWHDSLRKGYAATITLDAGPHTVRVEYYERGGGAAIQVSWERIAEPTSTPTPVPTITPTPISASTSTPTLESASEP